MSDLIADNARFAKVAAPLFPLEHKTKLAHKSGDRGDDVGTVQVDVSGERERERDLGRERECVCRGVMVISAGQETDASSRGRQDF